MKNNEIANKKRLLRQRLKNTRSALSASQRNEFSQLIAQSLLIQPKITQAETIFVYISYASEVETHDLIDQLLNLGKKLAVPKILTSNEMISVQFTEWDDLKTAELGILTPRSVTPMKCHFDVCITPGLGFTTSGKRIGFGAGYYDRWFSQNSVGEKIAMAYDSQIIEDIPTDEYDQLVNTIITETRVITASASLSQNEILLDPK